LRGDTSPLFYIQEILKKLEGILKEVAGSLVEGTDCFVVDATVSGGKNSMKARVLIDCDQGLTIDACADISRKLSAKIEEMNLIQGKYILEVSSPGTDHPLVLKRQYTKNVGRKVKVALKDNKTLEGQLTEANNDHICILTESKKEGTKEHKIPFEEIKETKVLVSFK